MLLPRLYGEQTPWGFLAVMVHVSPGPEGSTGPFIGCDTHHHIQESGVLELRDTGSCRAFPG